MTYSVFDVTLNPAVLYSTQIRVFIRQRPGRELNLGSAMC